jgi:phosphate transport system protein
VIGNDARIDQARNTLEERIITFFATQQPVAQDLRLVAVVAAIATELERIGDYASGIARRVPAASDMSPRMMWPVGLEQMIDRVQAMLQESLEALLNQDEQQARSLGQKDEYVNQLRDSLRLELVALARNDTQYLDSAIDMIDVVRMLERAADRATNIGERVIYLVTNEMEEINA